MQPWDRLGTSFSPSKTPLVGQLRKSVLHDVKMNIKNKQVSPHTGCVGHHTLRTFFLTRDITWKVINHLANVMPGCCDKLNGGDSVQNQLDELTTVDNLEILSNNPTCFDPLTDLHQGSCDKFKC